MAVRKKRKATPAQLAALKKGRAKLMAKRARKNPTTRKKKATVRKKIAVNAKSRATGKAPSALLKKRRARNTVPGAYPNPKARTRAVHIVSSDGSRIIYNYLLDDGGPILRFDSGNGFIDRALLKDKGYKLRRGWPDKGKVAYPNPAKRKQYVIAAIHSSGAVLGFFDQDRFGAKIYAQKYGSKEAATHDAKLAMKRLPARSGVAAFAIVPHYKSIASIEIDTRKMGKA